MPPAPTLDTYRDLSRQIIRERINNQSACALIGYPDHWNAGDTAIWCGTRNLLNELGCRVAYACDPWSYNRQALAAALPEGPILICGGGNFGDVYPDETSLRRRVLEDFADRTIVQLPQSIWFREDAGRDAMARLLDHQKNFTLLVRDEASLALAQRHFSVPSALCPDSALHLVLPVVATPPMTSILCLWRGDIEAGSVAMAAPPGGIMLDWTDPAQGFDFMRWRVRAFHRWVGSPPYGNGYRCPPRRAWAWKYGPSLWDALARERTMRGASILRQGHVVITNRLHAYIFCLLMDIPCVACDTANGKLSAFNAAWPIANARLCLAHSSPEALHLAEKLRAGFRP